MPIQRSLLIQNENRALPIVLNSLIKSCHSNKKSKFGKSHVTDDVITLDVTWKDILWQKRSCCGLTVFYLKKTINSQSYKDKAF